MPLRAEAANLAAQRAQVVQVQPELQQFRAQRDAMAAASAETECLTLDWRNCGPTRLNWLGR